jgi:hypothetical protein
MARNKGTMPCLNVIILTNFLYWSNNRIGFGLEQSDHTILAITLTGFHCNSYKLLLKTKKPIPKWALVKFRGLTNTIWKRINWVNFYDINHAVIHNDKVMWRYRSNFGRSILCVPGIVAFMINDIEPIIFSSL